MSERLHKDGRRFPGFWAMDADGNPTDDPSVLFADPPGTLLPIGGREYGHKGYGLALMIEALTQGLSGHGPREAPSSSKRSIRQHLQGARHSPRQTAFLAEACRSNSLAPEIDRVRLPGQSALERRRRALAEGVACCRDTGNPRAPRRACRHRAVLADRPPRPYPASNGDSAQTPRRS